MNRGSTMDKRVGIVSYGILEYGDQKDIGNWADEVAFMVARQALDKAGLSRDDIDVVVISTMDCFDGITISNGLLAPAAGAYLKEAIRIENSGLHCVMSAMSSILSDTADIVIVASADTVKTDIDYVTNSNQDQFFRGPLAFDAHQSFGLLSMDYLRKSGATENDFAAVASKNYRCGTTNRFGHRKVAHSTQDVLSSPLVNWPLRDLEIAKPSYGGAAIVLASEKRARQLSDRPIWLTGIGAANNNYSGSWQELSGMAALEKAGKKAYKMAGIKDPGNEIDLMEVLNSYSPFELMAYEALGICEKGGGAGLLRDGVTYADGDLPVNPSGGALCTNPLNSGGIYRIVQGLMELGGEGRLDKRKNPRRCLVHDSDMSIGAVGGDSHAVLIMEREG